MIDNCEFGYWEVPIIHPLYDEDGNVVYETKGKNKGKPKGDKALTEKARVPFSYENGIDGFYETEVKPYSPDAWINKTEIKVGYEISFTKYFYNPDELQDTLAIISDLESKHSQTSSFLQKIISEAQLSQQSTSIILQDSGNRFLGRIPAHWKLVNLWQICSEQK